MNRVEQLNRYIAGLRSAENRAVIHLVRQNTRKFPHPNNFRPSDYMAIRTAISKLKLLNQASIQIQILEKNSFSLN